VFCTEKGDCLHLGWQVSSWQPCFFYTITPSNNCQNNANYMKLADAIDTLTPRIDRYQIAIKNNPPTMSYKYINLHAAQELHKTLLMSLANEGNRDLTPDELTKLNAIV
jgi:hypothetical protein